jgi:predicted metallopeptidase
LPIKYFEAPEIKKQVDQLAQECEFYHVVPQFVFCVRSKGSKARRTIARIHGLGKIWQGVLNLPPSYTIEIISEIFDRMSPEDKERTLIHELMHIPGGFSGGFRPHKGYVERKMVEEVYKKLQSDRASKRQKHLFSSNPPSLLMNVFKVCSVVDGKQCLKTKDKKSMQKL